MSYIASLSSNFAMKIAFEDLTARYISSEEENRSLKAQLTEALKKKTPPPLPTSKPKLPNKGRNETRGSGLEEVVSELADQVEHVGLQLECLMDDLEQNQTRVVGGVDDQTGGCVVDELVKVEEAVSNHLLHRLSRLNHYKTCKQFPSSIRSFETLSPGTSLAFSSTNANTNNDVVSLEDLQTLWAIIREDNQLLKKTQWSLEKCAVKGIVTSPQGDEGVGDHPNRAANYRNRDDLPTITEEWTFLPSR